MRDIRNNGKEGGQTNESLNTRAAHAADAARDAVATGWEEAGSHRGGADRERDPERGAAPRPLWARGRAAPQPTLPPGLIRPLKPRAFTLPVARNNRSKLRHRGEFGEAGGEPQPRPAPRPAPRRRTCDRCEAPHSRPAALALRGRGALGCRAPPLSEPPTQRPREPPAARPPARRAAPARLTHIAPQLLLGRRFPQPAGTHHVVAAAAHVAG